MGRVGKSYTGPMPDPARPGSIAMGPGRWALWGITSALAWLAGVAMQLGRPELPDALGLQCAAAGAVLAGLLGAAARWLPPRRPGARRRPIGIWLVTCAAAAGWSLTGLQAADRLSDRLPAALEGIDLVVTGVVVDLPHGGVQRLATLSTGMGFGEAAITVGGVRTADVRADSVVECATLDVRSFEQLQRERPALALVLMRNLLIHSHRTAARLTREVSALEG